LLFLEEEEASSDFFEAERLGAEPLDEEVLRGAAFDDEDFSDFSADDGGDGVFLPLPFLFLRLPRFCTFEVVASALTAAAAAAAGRFAAVSLPALLLASFVGRAGATTAGTSPALERVTGAMVLFGRNWKCRRATKR
jgi:hypothetical protein